MQFLETPPLKELLPSSVESAFRKKSLLFHPDKLRDDASENDVERAKFMWETLIKAKDTLLGFLDNKTCFSEKCQARADELYKSMEYSKVFKKQEYIFQKNKKQKVSKKSATSSPKPPISIINYDLPLK